MNITAINACLCFNLLKSNIFSIPYKLSSKVKGLSARLPTTRMTGCFALPLKAVSIEKLKTGGQPRLDGPTGKAVLQFTLAALQSAATGKEVRPDDVA